MKQLLYILGFLWVFPVSFVTWLAMSVLYLFGQISDFKVTIPSLAFTWEIRAGSWLYRLGTGWYGTTAGNNIILFSDIDKTRGTRNFRHELEHVKQHYRWGIFFFPVYIIESACIWLFRYDRHAYFCNHFEKEARKAAGQLVDVPREQWPDGPNDRNPWF